MNESLTAKLNALRGRKIGSAEGDSVIAAFDWVPRRLLELMQAYPLATTKFALEESEDESGLGVKMRWLTPLEMIDEACNMYPGIAAIPHHYFPIGTCVFGTGDPYFIHGDNSDLPVCRIPHAAVLPSGELVLEQVERVSPSLESFLLRSTPR